MSHDHVGSRRSSLGDAVTAVFGLGILAAGIAVFARNNLGNHYFWADESSAFITSLGWPGPGQEPGDLADIWQTLIAFLDPGLFQLMTRAWSDVFGTSIVALRALPFMFFLVYVLALLRWYRLVGAPWVVAAAGVSVMLLENITPYYAVEVRPYSSSLAAAVVLPLLVLWLRDRPTWVRFAGYVVVFSFFASLQFASVSVQIASGALLLIFAWWTKDRAARLRLVLAAVVSVTVLPAIYLATRGNPFSDKTSTLEYIGDTVIRFQTPEQIAHTLFVNFLSFTALPRTVFLVLVPALWLTHRLALPNDKGQPRHRLIGFIWMFVTLGTLAAAALSVLGFLPWVVGTRWSIVEIGYIALSLVGLVGLFMLTGLQRRQWVAIAMTIVSLAIVVVGAVRMANYHRANDVNYMRSLAPAILEGRPGGTIVDYWIYPDARYWMEYSGEVDESYRLAWIDHGVNEITPGFPAGAAEIQTFLDAADLDRFLLRNRTVLEQSGIELPPGVEIVEVDPEQMNGADPARVPIVLVKPD